jgi:hypothetical protein
VSRQSPAELIESYLSAFRRVNPDAPLPVIEFHQGWYRYSFGMFAIQKKLRAAALAQMRDTLLQRSKSHHNPVELIEQYRQAFALAHPGHDVPTITVEGDVLRFKERGEYEVDLRAEDLAEKRDELLKRVANREFDLTTLAGLAAATDQAHRASQVYFREHIAARLEAVKTLEEFMVLKSEVCMGCAGPKGTMFPMPPEFDVYFMMKVSDLKHDAREAAKGQP